MSDRVLVDSSAWGDYLRGRGRMAPAVLRLVAEDRVWLHATVIGEVRLGGVDLAGRFPGLPLLQGFVPERVLAWLALQEVGAVRGVGWADCEIVHAAAAHHVPLLTADGRQQALLEGRRA